EKGDRPVFHAAQAALLAIPGHAEYYRDRILKAREEYEHTQPEMGPHPAKLVDEQRSHRQQTAAGAADPAITAAAPSTSGPKALSRTAALIAILAVLAAGTWYFLRRRNSPPT
ncbi:MAG: hypothetical protein K9N23_04085, partial [Akkermansiaceae bacterium]|nr:hypothetical protein [Akkermansiaceae bacterium]